MVIINFVSYNNSEIINIIDKKDFLENIINLGMDIFTYNFFGRQGCGKNNFINNIIDDYKITRAYSSYQPITYKSAY